MNHMQPTSYENQTFEKIIYTGTASNGKEYHECSFIKCDLSSSDFCNNRFVDCIFEDCNLSMVKLGGSTLNNVIFKNSKLMGVDFRVCDDFLFQVEFENCVLDYSSFMGKKMPKTLFSATSLKEVNFTQAKLSGAIFKEADLTSAIFNETELHSANFVTAYNYSIDPELNNVKKAAFSTDGLHGLLTKHNLKIV